MRQPGPDRWSRDARVYRWQEPLEARALARLTGLLDIPTDAVVVDVGAGPGTLTRRLRAARPDSRVLAVEPSARMVEVGDFGGAGVVRADATRLPLGSGTVDAVTAGFVLHVLGAPVRAAAVREAARVLRPGGCFGIVVPAAAPSRAARVVRWGTMTAVRLVGRGEVLSVPGDLDVLLHESGFDVVADVTTGGGYWSRVLVSRRA